MNITYMVPVDGKYVDLKSLSEAEQERIRNNLTKTLADAIAKEEAKEKAS